MTLTLNKPVTATELLMQSAPVARKLGHKFCAKSLKTGDCNGSYHGIWQFLRLLDMVSSPVRSKEFYLERLSKLARTGNFSNVMISGAADYAMLSLAAQAYAAQRAPIQVYQLDRCPTPLLMGDWYAEKVGMAKPVSFVGDILDASFAEQMDVICTHSFVAQFPPSQRPQLLSSWKNMLRVGGVVITCIRIDPEASGEPVCNSPEQVAGFAELVKQALDRMPEIAQEIDENFVSDAVHFSETRISYPFSSAAEISDMFTSAGFVMDSLDIVKKKGNTKINGPVVKKAAQYAHIVARKI